LGYENEFRDVHEGGEFSWLQRIADHIKYRGFRYEAHGDNIRIILGKGFTIDFGSEPDGLCFYTRTLLPIGDDYDELSNYLDSLRLFTIVTALFKRPVKYYIDDSLGNFIILNAKSCYKTPEEIIKVIDRFYDYLMSSNE